ncbi:MAG: UV DNA damage repair endonuclease UvsE [Mycobacterium leprae]
MRFGYACISTLIPDSSPAKTVTVKRLETIADPDARIEICRRVARTNLQNTRRLIFHNAASGLLLYRITPQLVPLATHPIMAGWDWESDLADDFAAVGEVMRAFGMRISSHPGQYTVLGSARPEVVRAAVADLEYHARLHERLDHGSAGRIILHVGGAQGGKEAAMERLAQNLSLVSPSVRKRLTLENDDTTYGTGEVLPFCQRLGLPMTFDIHHHQLNPAGAELESALPAVLATWSADEPPKMHVSSPRDAQNPKAHADYVDAQQFRTFLAVAHTVGFEPFDVMVEAKMKDAAAIKLAADLGIALAGRVIGPGNQIGAIESALPAPPTL